MLPIKEARAQLKRTGTARAAGDALRFMYANLLAIEKCLISKANFIGWPVSDLYELLGKVPDDQIRNEYKRLQQSW